MDEFALIRRFFTGIGPRLPEVLESLGDDCALLQLQAKEQLALSIDTSVAGRHFPEGADPWAIGWRCLAVALSDLAAMGARPLGFTLAITLPEADEHWLNEFSKGLKALADQAACPLIGGDTTRGPLTLSVQVHGAVTAEHVWRRKGAQPGQLLAALGHLGSAAAGLQSLQEHPQRLLQRESWNAFEQAYLLPQPLIKEAQRLIQGVGISAAIDVSDGLLADLQHLLASSAVAAELDLEQLPIDPQLIEEQGRTLAMDAALHGGDDYALLMTLDETDFDLARSLCPQLKKIGVITRGAGIRTPQGRVLEPLGYNHFSATSGAS